MSTNHNKQHMKQLVKCFFFISCLFCFAQEQTFAKTKDNGSYDYLKSQFQNPNSQYGVNCWWWWLNGNVTKEAIKKDLEAMKSRHFQGAMIFDAGGHNQRGNKTIPAGPLYGSKEWIDLFVYALDEAQHLGLEIGFNIQSGWNLGGPCITPQYAAKQLTYSETTIEGGNPVQTKLKQPTARKNFYKDIVVYAFPANEENETSERIEDLDLKLGFHELGGSAPDCRFLLFNVQRKKEPQSVNNKYKINIKEIIDLTDKMNKDGVLTWNAPQGRWNIIRIGYTCTASTVSTASNGWQGLVLDYMSKDAFKFYWDTVVAPILRAAGKHVGNTLKYMETDSWECGGMNWTDSFAEEFNKFCGYDVKCYLPIIAGHIIENIDVSNAFLADFRKTIGHLVSQNHYAYFAEKAHFYDMGIQPESAGPHAGPLDGIKNYGFSDIVMSEFWSPSPHRISPQDRFFVKQASSAAHIYGKKIIGAESFTTIGPHWNDELWCNQKPAFDHEICAGLNRVYFHTFTCSPNSQGIPGQEYFAGTHINPQVTWWNKSAPFIDYMRRIQMLAQEGDFVADILYYYGDHVPNIYPFKQKDLAGALDGFDYDVTDETVFMQLKVENGHIIVPSGKSYRVLVLPDHKVLSFSVLRKTEQLLKDGAHIIGYKPLKPISLIGGKSLNSDFKYLADKIWGTSSDSPKGERKYGKGKILWGIKAKEYLLSQQLNTDFSIEGNDFPSNFDYIHYKTKDMHFYFVSNQTEKRQKINANFRVVGKQPELWNALTGEIRDAVAFTQKEKETQVPLMLDPCGSIIVVFHEKLETNTNGEKIQNDPEHELIKTLDGPWYVQFDSRWGGPDSIIFPQLIDWTNHKNVGIKYYSGTATYKKTFYIKKETNEHYYIQLGNIKDIGIASININGKDKGIVWTYPFQVEITDALKNGENNLIVEVTNSWYNRVAGDEISTSNTKKYTQTNIVLKNDFKGNAMENIKLEPSGLLGPVTITKAKYK